MSFFGFKRHTEKECEDILPFDFVEIKLSELNKEMGITS